MENKWVVKSGGEFDYRWMVSSQGLSLGNDRIVLYLDCSGGYTAFIKTHRTVPPKSKYYCTYFFLILKKIKSALNHGWV